MMRGPPELEPRLVLVKFLVSREDNIGSQSYRVPADNASSVPAAWAAVKGVNRLAERIVIVVHLHSAQGSSSLCVITFTNTPENNLAYTSSCSQHGEEEGRNSPPDQYPRTSGETSTAWLQAYRQQQPSPFPGDGTVHLLCCHQTWQHSSSWGVGNAHATHVFDRAKDILVLTIA